MAQSLAVKYRPSRFETVLGQQSVIKILQRQLETRKFTNCYLFAGPSGDGKTTLARIFAKAINEGKGEPNELDAASIGLTYDPKGGNITTAIRYLTDEAKQRAIDATYRVYIIDECHMLSTSAWNAFLKTIEEPPEYTIFMFCTTDPQKIPATILNRVMRFNLTKVATPLIKTRLCQICENEEYTNFEDSCDFIAKLADGGVRDAIANLQKCAEYSKDLSIDNVLVCLGDMSYDTLFDLTGALLNQDQGAVLQTIEDYYNSGKDIKQFIEKYLEFALDLTKYCIFRNMDMIKIPVNLKARCEGFANIPDITVWTNKLVDNVLKIKKSIVDDSNKKLTVEAMMLAICRE